MSKADLAKLSKGVNTLKRMATRLLSKPKKAKGTKKAKGAKKPKGTKKAKKPKGTKKARNNQKGGSTISYQLGGQELSPADLNMATHAPISPSAGHSFYDMSDMKANGSFI